jgi:hypothetical protein
VKTAEAICAIFLAVERLHDLGLPDARGSKVRRETHFLWELREGAKLGDARPHSLPARLCRQRGQIGELTYEHSIPLATVMPLLRKAAGSPSRMLELLKKCVQPVLVTKEEGRRLASVGLGLRMPASARDYDPLTRYVQAGIEIEPARIELPKR